MGLSPWHTEATTAGHPEDTKPKPGVDKRAAKGGKGQVMCEIKNTKTGPYAN
jgi:hypothetical protein